MKCIKYVRKQTEAWNKKAEEVDDEVVIHTYTFEDGATGTKHTISGGNVLGFSPGEDYAREAVLKATEARTVNAQ